MSWATVESPGFSVNHDTKVFPSSLVGLCPMPISLMIRRPSHFHAGMIFVVSIFCWYLRVSVFWRWLCAREIWIMPTPCNDIFIFHLSPQSPHLTFRNSSEAIFHLAMLQSLQRCNDCWHWLIVIFANCKQSFLSVCRATGGDKVQGCHSSR